jgi:hypothetical protein
MSYFIRRGESGDHVLVSSLVRKYNQFNVGRISLKEIVKYGNINARTASSVLDATDRDSVSVDQAGNILFAAIGINYENEHVKKLETGIHQTLTRKFITDSGPEEHARISGICKYVTRSNDDFPTNDLIEVWKIRKLLKSYAESHDVKFIALNPKCGLKTGTIEFVLEKDFLTHVNMDLVVHISRRLLEIPTSPTFYERDTRQRSH